MEETTTAESTKQLPVYLVDPDIWRAFAQEFARIWTAQADAIKGTEPRQRRRVR